MSFAEKVALITGGSSGIGADAAYHFAKLGAKVSIVGQNRKRLNALAKEIQKSGSPTPLVIVADVTKESERIVDETVKHFEKLDILVNNTGFAIPDSVTVVDLSEFDYVFHTNVHSVIRLTKLCVPHLEKTKGNVVNISSIVGIQASRGIMTSSMSKAALDQFTRCSALDLAQKGIRVNSVRVNAVRTHAFKPFGRPTEKFEEIIERNQNMYTVAPMGVVTGTSEAIAFLANASFLTGIILPVDEGSTASFPNYLPLSKI